MTVYDAAICAFPMRPVFDSLAAKFPEKYKIFEPADYEFLEAFINVCNPMKVLVMMVRYLNSI